MTPERLGELQLLRQKIMDPATPTQERLAAVRLAVQMVRDERGIVNTNVEKKAAKKKAATIDTEALLNDFIGKPSSE